MAKPPMTKEELLEHIKAHTIKQDDCWTYYRSLDKDGYGIVYLGRDKIRLHRFSAHIFLGLNLDDSDSLILHKAICKFKNCWNPDHIYVGTHVSNMGDFSKSKTHCPRGHLYTYRKSGKKVCNICEKLWARNRYKNVKLRIRTGQS